MNGEGKMNDAEKIAEALKSIATHIKYLGGGDSADQRGAIEFLGIQLEEAGKSIAESINNLAEAIRETGTLPKG